MSPSKLVQVRDVMNPQVDMVDGMATVREALRALQHVENKCLVVKKRHEHDEYGMLLLSDVARKVLAQDRAPDRVNVYEVMTKPVISVEPGMDIRYCARLFDRFGLTRAPVVECGEVLGVVSFTDLVLRGMLAGE
ncbi:MAG: CBS domain-containing protein [Gammaproteobacteria bacterium]|uniref:CBS domain protein n=1 Tax=Thioalbus denitrificans TaxID=547122 RepID=A0A369CLB6_9GAMM|nr:CBS domain-containing protein [Thioalbus denitrificans]MDD3449736.1 CBS domain-containing protein [Gammaproteobacteria bacterium]RCX33476.1 CBS domain protein [Thioalbus denitrificans]